MEAILVLKDTLDVHVLSTLTPICKEQIADSVSCVNESSQANMAICHDCIWITLIICTTILLLTLSVVGMILYYKSRRLYDMQNEREEKDKAEKNQRESQKLIDIEKEKSDYRKRLINYLELRGKDGEYVTELKSFINNLKPSNNEYDITSSKSEAQFVKNG